MTTAVLNPCTCGEAHPHEVMRRQTADGYFITLDSDAKVLTVLGAAVRGVPVRRPRTLESHRLALAAGRLFMHAVGFYSGDELGPLYTDACAAAKSGTTIRDVQHARQAVPV